MTSRYGSYVTAWRMLDGIGFYCFCLLLDIPYDVKGYRRIWSAVEMFNAWLKTFRRATIRYERLAVMFKAITTFTSTMIHIRYRL